jgi:hypothetical protein
MKYYWFTTNNVLPVIIIVRWYEFGSLSWS